MKATNWEFTNRALVFGLIFGLAFPLYVLDQTNCTAALANWLGGKFNWNADLVARALFACATLFLSVSALIRTWASAYLQADVVYASEVKTQSLVADGPYRYVRNPLYFANVLMAIGLGSMMSRLGFVAAVGAMLIFSYRLIFREEGELQAAQGEQYVRFKKAVPRLLPSPWPRIASAGRKAKWGAGFRAESWYWGSPAGVLAFAITLNLKLFFLFLTLGIGLLWVSSRAFQKKSDSAPS